MHGMWPNSHRKTAKPATIGENEEHFLCYWWNDEDGNDFTLQTFS